MRNRFMLVLGLVVIVSLCGVAGAVQTEESQAASKAEAVSQPQGVSFQGPMVDFSPPAGASDLKWMNPDVVVSNPAESESNPALASAPSGELFAAVDRFGTGRILIYHSTDGGETWSWLASFVHGSDSRNPSLAYAENSGTRYLVLVYEYVVSDILRSVYSYRIDVDDPQNTGLFTGVALDLPWSSPSNQLYPQVTCDFPAFSSGVYFYLTYATPNIDYYPVFFTRTTDRAATWEASVNITGGSENTGMESRPEVAFSAHRNDVYVVFNKPGWTGTAWAPQIWVAANTLWGGSASWLAPVQVSSSSLDEYHPSVAAAWDSDTVMVAWTREYSADDNDVKYSYSTDGGAVWSTTQTMPSWTFDLEDNVDLAVSHALSGRFHAVYRHRDPDIMSGGDIWYSWTDVSTPGSWSSALDVSADTYASGLTFYPRPAICVDQSQAPEDEAAVAWTRWSPFYHVLFDSAILSDFDGIFEDDFETGDDSRWSSSVP